MNQARGAQGVIGALPPERAPSDAAQLVVDVRKELIHRPRVTPARAEQEAGDGLGVGRWEWYPGFHVRSGEDRGGQEPKLSTQSDP